MAWNIFDTWSSQIFSNSIHIMYVLYSFSLHNASCLGLNLDLFCHSDSCDYLWLAFIYLVMAWNIFDTWSSQIFSNSIHIMYVLYSFNLHNASCLGLNLDLFCHSDSCDYLWLAFIYPKCKQYVGNNSKLQSYKLQKTALQFLKNCTPCQDSEQQFSNPKADAIPLSHGGNRDTNLSCF
jgi:hypothetical protein